MFSDAEEIFEVVRVGIDLSRIDAFFSYGSKDSSAFLDSIVFNGGSDVIIIKYYCTCNYIQIEISFCILPNYF